MTQKNRSRRIIEFPCQMMAAVMPSLRVLGSKRILIGDKVMAVQIYRDLSIYFPHQALHSQCPCITPISEPVALCLTRCRSRMR